MSRRPKARAGWGAVGEGCVASLTPDQPECGTGGAERRGPSGAAAYGMARYRSPNRSRRPRTVPEGVSTTGCGCWGTGTLPFDPGVSRDAGEARPFPDRELRAVPLDLGCAVAAQVGGEDKGVALGRAAEQFVPGRPRLDRVLAEAGIGVRLHD